MTARGQSSKEEPDLERHPAKYGAVKGTPLKISGRSPLSFADSRIVFGGNEVKGVGRAHIITQSDKCP
jgi:hypothetical protein